MIFKEKEKISCNNNSYKVYEDLKYSVFGQKKMKLLEIWNTWFIVV